MRVGSQRGAAGVTAARVLAAGVLSAGVLSAGVLSAPARPQPADEETFVNGFEESRKGIRG